jgi:acyl-CoA synthetase (NDP forming)
MTTMTTLTEAAPQALESAEDRPTPERIREFLNPRSIAVIGASNTSNWSHFALGNLLGGGYTGELHLVNRRGEPVRGRETYTTIADVPGTPDLAIILTGGPTIEGLLAECRAKGVRNAVVLAGGFAEAGPEGAALQERIVADAKAADQLFLGPNNLGFINTGADTVAFAHMTQIPPVKGTVGVASQSGALSIYLIPYMASRGVGTSVTVTVGNEAMLSAVDVMDFLVDDPGTTVITAYLEQIANPEQFIAVAERARAAGKPVVVFKAGKSEVAARVAAAHTGSLVGDDRITDAVLKQLGVIRVDSIEQLVSTAGLLAQHGALPGPRIGFVTASGAMCSVIAERSADTVIELPQPAAETAAGLHEDGMPEEATVNNPLDLTGITANNNRIIPQAIQRFIDDPSIDVVVAQGQWPGSEQEEAYVSQGKDFLLETIANSPKPVVLMNFLATEVNAYGREFAERTDYPHVADSFDRGIPALAHAAWWGERTAELASEDRSNDVVPVPAPTGVEDWTEVETSAFLKGHGVPVVPTVLAGTAEEAVAVAEACGYPVVLKIASKDIAHKSDVGGVKLNLATPDAVRSAYADIVASVAAKAPDAEVAGVAVAPMRSGGAELLVGVVRDEAWGHILAVGLGGVFVEVLKDTQLRRLPIGKDEAKRMLGQLKAAKVLEGFRGSAPADLDAVAEAIVAIGDLAVGLGDAVHELEINPLLVDGSRVEAADALISWNRGERAPNAAAGQ